MESRRCAKPTRRSGEIHSPAPSGPRCTIVSRIRTRYSSVTWKLLFLNASTPEIPHICRHPSLYPNTRVCYGRNERASLGTLDPTLDVKVFLGLQALILARV